MKKYKCESVRLCRYLYSLGFDKESIYENGKEFWLFEESDDLQKSLGFFFSMRKKLKKQKIYKERMIYEYIYMFKLQ